MKVVYEDTAYVPVNQKAIKNILNFFFFFFSKMHKVSCEGEV